jgi:glutaredoxin
VKAKRYLKDKGIRFKDIDVSRDMKAAQDMERRTGQRGVPVLLIDNKPVVGFDVPKINRLLDIV